MGSTVVAIGMLGLFVVAVVKAIEMMLRPQSSSHCVLHCLVKDGQPRHAYQLIKETGIGSGRMYPALYILERDGLITGHESPLNYLTYYRATKNGINVDTYTTFWFEADRKKHLWNRIRTLIFPQ
jgi:Transcriptional regulator PadR-like family